VSGLSTLTDGSGKYALPGVRGLQLLFEKSAYESKVFQANPDTEDEDVPMQSIVRVGVGETGSTLLAPNDLTYTVAPGINCSPCRMIRVVAPRPGPLEVRLKWGDSRARMELWIEGRRFQPDPAAGLEAVAELTVPAGELLVYVSSTKLSFGTHVPISISVVAK
jgi:hypothetical protein